MIDQALKLLGLRRVKSATLTDPEWWRQMGHLSPTAAGVSVTPDNAMTTSAVYACVRVLAESVASLPLKVYRKTPDGREEYPNHPLNRLLGNSPNGEQTAYEMREFQMANLGLRGNAYAQKMFSGSGRVGEIQPLNARFMEVTRDESGALVFDYTEPGNTRTLTVDQVWRIAGLGSDGVTGSSPIQTARESIGLSLATEGYASGLFGNGATPSGVLEYEHQIADDQIASLRKQFADNHIGPNNSRKPMILESGMKYQAIGLTATDAQFLESRRFQIHEICRIYRVPPHMVAELGKATYANIEHESIGFVVNTLRPWLVRIEGCIWRDLLLKSEQKNLFVSHSVDALLRGDTKTRYEAYGKAITDGWMTRAEVRQFEDLPPIPGLDVPLMPLNMAPVGADGTAASTEPSPGTGGDD